MGVAAPQAPESVGVHDPFKILVKGSSLLGN